MLGTTHTAVKDIDRPTALVFAVDLQHAIDTSDEAFVSVDCSGVTFVGSAGYRVLLSLTAYAIRRGHTLVIRDMSPACARIIRLCDTQYELRTSDGPARYEANV